MADFEKALATAMQSSMLKLISSGNWIESAYSDRFKVPKELLADAYKMVDTESLKVQLARRIEAELADRIINHLAAEMATDVKQILSIKERREALRNIARTHLETIMQAGTLTQEAFK